MNIAEVSKKYGLSCDTLRYYEKIGVLQDVHRTVGGIRDYNDEDMRALEFVKCLRDAGVSLKALSEYMTLLSQGDATLRERQQILLNEREKLKSRLDDLNQAFDRLNYKIKWYDESIQKYNNNAGNK